MSDEYDRLFHIHRAEVVRICRRHLADGTEAEDVAQEVFLRLARRWCGDDRPTAMRAWLARVAVNLCRRRHRAQRRAAHGGPEVAELPSGTPTPEESAISREHLRDVLQRFRHLPRRQRE